MTVREKARVVFDCNVFLQAAARAQGPAAACLRLVENGYLRLYLSPEILREVEEVLSYPEIRERFKTLTDEIVQQFIEHVRELAETPRYIPKRFAYQRDVDDEPYINLAIAARADYLVSRDRDLLDLMTGITAECKEFRQRFRFLRVVEPTALLQLIERASPDT